MNLSDLDAEGEGRVPLEDCRFTVKQYHSGRWRFNFVLPDIPPGRYRVRVAFAVKDATQPPRVAEGRFEVRPPPGYVPPPDESPTPSAIALETHRPSPAPVAPMGAEPLPAPSPAAARVPPLRALTDPSSPDHTGPPAPIAPSRPPVVPMPRPAQASSAVPVALAPSDPASTHPSADHSAHSVAPQPTPLAPPESERPTRPDEPVPAPVAVSTPPQPPTPAAVAPPAAVAVPDTRPGTSTQASPTRPSWTPPPAPAEDLPGAHRSGGGERDLPSYHDGRRRPPRWDERIRDLVERDAGAAIAVGVAASAFLLLVISFLVRAC